MMPLKLRDGVTLYFSRHGETVANVQRRFQGITTDTALTAKGKLQAASVARLLAREAPSPATLAYVSSPMPRAQKTMRIVRETLGLTPGDFVIENRIREIDLGNWDGHTDEELIARDAEAFRRREADKWNVRVPGGGENYADVAARATSWIADLSRDTFAVSHGAFTRILRGLFAGLDWEGMSALDEKQGVLFRVRGSAVERFEES